jgi:general secretion pathway protein G
MTRTRRDCARRAGFTLVELLVVIVIIAILVALTAAGVMAVLRQGPEKKAQQEIANLVNAIEQAKNGLNPEGGPLPFLPSKILLDETGGYVSNGGYTNVGTADWFAVTFLRKAFGKRMNPLQPIDWNGDGLYTTYFLQGHQALVFWLGGVPSGTTMTGWSTNPTNPGLPGGTRKAPFYTFPGSQLAAVSATNNFPYYVDAFNNAAPYAYFSSYYSGNDYNTVPTDCPSIVGLSPYMTPAGKFINPKGFQIISAGRDGVFGPGGPWNGYGPWTAANPGGDDLANFSSSVLGSPPG